LSESTNTLYFKALDGFQLDYLWAPKPDAKRLFVLFSGDAMREKNHPPVFQRWTWSSFFPGHCLYVSDPSLFLDDTLGLAWYSGTAEFDPMPKIIEAVCSIVENFAISRKEIYAYGSSGGGFASLRFAAMLQDAKAICINPQTDITKYKNFGAKKYLRIAFNNLEKEKALEVFPERMTLSFYRDELMNTKIVYIQNDLDQHHYDDHYKPFCEFLNQPNFENTSNGNFRRLIFSHEGGHKKAETPEVFAKAMSIVEEWSA